MANSTELGPEGFAADPGIIIDGRYEIFEQKGVVFDRNTGLMWKRGVEEGEFTFDGAQEHAMAANAAGGFAGHADWRVPTIDELLNLRIDQPGGNRDERKQGRDRSESSPIFLDYVGAHGSRRNADIHRHRADIRGLDRADYVWLLPHHWRGGKVLYGETRVA